MTPESVFFLLICNPLCQSSQLVPYPKWFGDCREGTLWKRILEICPDPDPPSSYGIGILTLNGLTTDSKQIRVIRNDSYYNLLRNIHIPTRFTILNFSQFVNNEYFFVLFLLLFVKYVLWTSWNRNNTCHVPDMIVLETHSTRHEVD